MHKPRPHFENAQMKEEPIEGVIEHAIRPLFQRVLKNKNFLSNLVYFHEYIRLTKNFVIADITFLIPPPF